MSRDVVIENALDADRAKERLRRRAAVQGYYTAVTERIALEELPARCQMIAP